MLEAVQMGGEWPIDQLVEVVRNRRSWFSSYVLGIPNKTSVESC